MKAFIRLRKLQHNRARAFVFSVDNEDVDALMDFRIDHIVYDQLLKNYKNTLLVEISNGTIEKFYEAVATPNSVMLNRYEVMKKMVNKDITRSELVQTYAHALNCSERTAQRHIKEAFGVGYLDETEQGLVVVSGVKTDGVKDL